MLLSGCGVSPYWTPGASWFRALDNPYRALACISWYRIPVSSYRTLEGGRLVNLYWTQESGKLVQVPVNPYRTLESSQQVSGANPYRTMENYGLI